LREKPWKRTKTGDGYMNNGSFKGDFLTGVCIAWRLLKKDGCVKEGSVNGVQA